MCGKRECRHHQSASNHGGGTDEINLRPSHRPLNRFLPPFLPPKLNCPPIFGPDITYPKLIRLLGMRRGEILRLAVPNQTNLCRQATKTFVI